MLLNSLVLKFKVEKQHRILPAHRGSLKNNNTSNPFSCVDFYGVYKPERTVASGGISRFREPTVLETFAMQDDKL